MNIRLVALTIGDALKYDISVNEIGRAASALFCFERESFPHDSITSQRAQLVFDWLMSLGKQAMAESERESMLLQFVSAITPSDKRAEIDSVLAASGIAISNDAELRAEFLGHTFHGEVVRHAQKYFLQQNFFHAVFESAKAFNKAVKDKARSPKDGQDLMLSVWGCERGMLKFTTCQSETDRNVQDGVKFLSAGLMSAIRNPTAHEPEVDWPISKTECLEVLGLVSFLFRRLELSVRVEPS